MDMSIQCNTEVTVPGARRTEPDAKPIHDKYLVSQGCRSKIGGKRVARGCALHTTLSLQSLDYATLVRSVRGEKEVKHC